MVETFQVGLEGAAFALIQVHPGHEQEFDRWYSHDHFYSGGLLAPGVLSGRRFIAGRELRASRYVDPKCAFPDPYSGNHIAVYWLTIGGLEAFFVWARSQIPQLRAEGRMFHERTQVNVDGYRCEFVLNSPGSSCVEPVVALDHDFSGLFVVYGEPLASAGSPPGGLPDDVLAITFRPEPSVLELGPDAASGSLGNPMLTTTVPVRMTMVFLARPPLAEAAWSAELAHAVGEATGSKPLWAGGFVSVDPGSSVYLREMV
jgi:hypothetical protein